MVQAADLCYVQLRTGDTLATLAREYSLAGGPGDGAREIAGWNGVAFDKRAIDAWVMSNGGRRLAFDARDPYDAATRTGWAVFTSSSVILMPRHGSRTCVGEVSFPPETIVAGGGKSSSALLWGAGILGVLALASTSKGR